MKAPENELRFEFLRSSGPGGQNVNKVATAVRLRFDVRASASLSDEVKARLLVLAGKRATEAGEIVILGQRHRTQEGNRKDVVERLETLLAAALTLPRPRRPTRPSKAAKARRLEAKRRRGAAKSRRRPGGEAD